MTVTFPLTEQGGRDRGDGTAREDGTVRGDGTAGEGEAENDVLKKRGQPDAETAGFGRSPWEEETERGLLGELFCQAKKSFAQIGKTGRRLWGKVRDIFLDLWKKDGK